MAVAPDNGSGAIEGLAKILSDLGDQGCRQILPPRAALLCRLFPSLSALPQLSAQPLSGLPADPSVQRLQAFSVLRRLLSRLSDDGGARHGDSLQRSSHLAGGLNIESMTCEKAS